MLGGLLIVKYIGPQNPILIVKAPIVEGASARFRVQPVLHSTLKSVRKTQARRNAIKHEKLADAQGGKTAARQIFQNASNFQQYWLA